MSTVLYFAYEIQHCDQYRICIKILLSVSIQHLHIICGVVYTSTSILIRQSYELNHFFFKLRHEMFFNVICNSNTSMQISGEIIDFSNLSTNIIFVSQFSKI